MKTLLLAIPVALLSPGPAELTLVEKGRPRAIIILADQPAAGVEDAAQTLRSHLVQISGAELKIRRDADAPAAPTADQPWILVGEGRRSRELGLRVPPLGPGGIHLRAAAHALFIAAKDSPSAAVATFLEDQLGVRYLWPGDLGKVLPRRETISIPEFDLTRTPELPSRHIRFLQYHDRLQDGLDRLGFTKDDYVNAVRAAERTSAGGPDWGTWQRLGGSLNVRGGHAYDDYWTRYGKDHPDWFALQPNGSRDQSASRARPRLCKSNPDLIAEIARNKIAELRADPTLLGVSIAPSDGGRTMFCTCTNCEALDAPDGRKIKWGDVEHVSYTDRVVWFWNAIAERVAKEYPDKLLVVDVYSTYSAPPVKRTLHPNLLLRVATLGGYLSQAARKQETDDFAAWARAGGRFYWRPNLLTEARRTGYPLLYPHTVAEDFRQVVEAGALGTDFDCICQHWATQGLNYYVVARLHWDVKQDVDALIDDYCRAGFGPAAKSVRRYYDALESARREALEAKVKQNLVFTEDVIARVRALLDQARREVGDEKQYRDRLAFLELGWRWTEAEGRALRAGKGSEERSALMREIFRASPLAVNVAYVAWGDGLGK
jgi:hypothetical protein